MTYFFTFPYTLSSPRKISLRTGNPVDGRNSILFVPTNKLLLQSTVSPLLSLEVGDDCRHRPAQPQAAKVTPGDEPGPKLPKPQN